MTVIISGDNGVSDVDGSAGTPAIRGTDANTGIFFGADQVGVATNGVERVEFGNSETVFNDGGASVDFRVEGDTEANLLFVDASADAVGIGTSSPASLLHLKSATSGAPQLRIEGSGADNGIITWLGGGHANPAVGIRYISTGDSVGSLAFYANGASSATLSERARITSGGAFLINGTSAPLENALMAITNGTVKWTVGPTSAGNFIVYNASSIGVYLVNGSNSWTGTSDERLKNITGTISNGLSKVNSLRAVEYTWKSDDTNKPQVGLIAQDVKEVLPQVVDENASGFLGIRYTDTIPLLVAAIQELKAINDAQASRIETLEAKVAALEAK